MSTHNICFYGELTKNTQKIFCYCFFSGTMDSYLGCVKGIWYLSPMRAAKVQASLRIRAVSPEPSLLAHTGSELRGTYRQKARSLAPLNGWACAVKICHDGMLEDTNSLGGAHIFHIHFQCDMVAMEMPMSQPCTNISKFKTKKAFRQTGLDKQCRPRSDCS